MKMKLFLSFMFLSSISYASCVGPYCYDDTGAYINGVHIGTIYFSDGSSQSVAATVTTPAGNNTEIQFNNNQSFGSDPLLFWNSGQSDLEVGSQSGRLTTDQPGDIQVLDNGGNPTSYSDISYNTIFVTDHDNTVISSAAVLQADSLTKGFLPPVTSTTNITNPVTGLIVYSTNTATLEFFNGSVWKTVTHN